MLVRCKAIFLLLLTLLTAVPSSSAAAAPKNIILMIGDGMGPDILTATGSYKFGGDYHLFGGRKLLPIEEPSHRLYATTFPHGGSYDPAWDKGNLEYPKKRATDSAASATALATGVKTYNGAIGVDMEKKPLLSVLEIAQQAGKRTGVVTSVPFCHATPAAFAAHSSSRAGYTDIAREMIFKTRPDVIMGGGAPDEAKEKFTYIAREDWEALKAGKTDYRLIQARDEFRQLAIKPGTGKVFGLALTPGSLKARKADGAGVSTLQPTLAEMTAGALSVLNGKEGFFLMVEGGAIDNGGHSNNLDVAIGETLGFAEAVTTVMEWIKSHGGWQENLLIITADHDTGYLHNVKPGSPGVLPVVSWGTDGQWAGHTNRPVPLFLQGSGSEGIMAYIREIEDFQRGRIRIVDNTDIFKVMSETLQRPQASLSILLTDDVPLRQAAGQGVK